MKRLGCMMIVISSLLTPPSRGQDAHVDEVKLTPESIRSHGIVVEPLKRHVLTPTFTAPARVAFNAEAMAHVGSMLQGRVVEIRAKMGDQVSKGDVLFMVQSPQLAEAQSEFVLKRTEAEAAGMAIEPVKQAYERAKSLHEKSEGMSLAEVQRRQIEWREAEARMTAARGAATAAENKLHAMGMDQPAVDALARTGHIDSLTAIRAPLAGQVIEREATLGELVSPDRDALMILADLSTVWVIADVPEARLAELAVGSAARVSLVAFPNQPLEGKVTYIAPALNPTNRTAGVRIEVPNAGSLRPEMFARVEISATTGSAAEPVLAIPESAVMTIEGEPSVFVPVPDEPDTFARKAVKIGKPVGGMLPLLDGLKENDAVVTRGVFILKAELGKSGAEHVH